ncbi:transmembrane protein 62-like isoform X1 [Lytechinus variegatus]|uniref:transmembrane protein 62-like isoform X1 n=1 Tax=Lytechinus variegatus TaxID=7654 RepID=UPI001BB1448E|nr:transmembrane protein 62-like isoform X1 [Lytechinus variegatus]
MQPPKGCLLITSVLVAIATVIYALVWSVHYFTVPVKYYGPPHPYDEVPPFPGETPDNLWWLVQISDTHLTTVENPEKLARARDFKIFCHEHLKVINPMLVLHTGDITDGAPHASQNKGDWISYQQIMSEAKLPYSLRWLDVRGNHDNFDVPFEQHENNFYREYSILGEKGDESFLYKMELPFGTYSFIHVDALLKIGTKRPINFYGILDELNVYHVKTLSERAKESPSNQTIYFGHYPTSTILAPHGLYDILKGGIAYLCGHLHDLDLKNGIKRMYVLQRYGSLELELEDWKKHRKFRVMAFDHDMLSFTDVQFGEWPIVLITNPKPARFLAPGHEPEKRMAHSSHIRMLVFSPSEIRKVKVEVDYKPLGYAEPVNGGPLYVLPWKPERYTSGLHLIEVTVKDTAGRYKTVIREFSLDQSRPNQPFMSSFVIMINSFIFLVLCIIGLECVCVFPLMFFRRYTERPQAGQQPVVACYAHFHKIGTSGNPLLYGLLLLVHTNDIYYPLMIIAVYPLIGPWLVGEVVTNMYGTLTLYGMYVNSTFIADKFPMLFFVTDLLCVHLPLTVFCLLHLSRAYYIQSSVRVKHSPNHSGNRIKNWRRLMDIALIIVSLFLLKSVLSRSLGTISRLTHWYGRYAFFVSPKYTWTCLIVVYVACRCVYIGYKGAPAPMRTGGTEATENSE